jgi:hypothetical protein
MSRNPKALALGHGQADSPAFRAWFEGSKVVDAQGKPLVVYRGSRKVEDANGIGQWFTSDRFAACEFARDKGSEDFEEGAVVGAYFLSLKKPLIIDAKGVDYNDLPAIRIAKEHEELGIPNDLDEIATDEIVALARKTGLYDGVIFKNVNESDAVVDSDVADTFVPFKPVQMKSATGNAGAFDPENPDIRCSRGFRQR